MFDSGPKYAIETETRPDRILVRNTGTNTVYASVYGETFLAAALIKPILDDRLKIAPGDVKPYLLGEIPKAEDESRLVVYWWNPVLEDGDVVAGSPRTRKIDLSPDRLR